MGSSKIHPLTEAVYYILLSLYKPLHGYGIMQSVKELTDNRLNLGAGTLYGALNTLLSKGYISEYSSSADKKEYLITAQGKQIVEAELNRLIELVNNGEKILEENR